MRKLLLLLAAMYSLNYCRANTEPINAIIGDISFIEIFGITPSEATSETLRIQTHLIYVEQLLRKADVTCLNKQQLQKRANALSLLHDYWMKAKFPSNYDFPDKRKPCFIDKKGNICAVGYLIEKTLGKSTAEAINKLHQYDYILSMQEPLIKKWAKQNGLTVEECAMIQPQYGSPAPPVTDEVAVKSSYGIASGFIGGTNLAINIINISSQNHHNKIMPYAGLLTGATEVVLGITNIRKNQVTYIINGGQTKTSYKAQNNLSYLNIAMGTSTIITSVFNIFLNKRAREKNTAFNLYSYPTNNKLTMNICFTRKI